MSALDAVLARLLAAAAELESLRPVVEARAPWPLAQRFGVEPEAAWGPPELLAHVAEMLPYWLGEVERVLDGSPEPVPFGRVQSDDLRIGIIGRDRTLPVRELYARIGSDVERYRRRLPALTATEAARRGSHPSFGEITVATLLERTVAKHLEDHVLQMREVLAGPAPGADA